MQPYPDGRSARRFGQPPVSKGWVVTTLTSLDVNLSNAHVLCFSFSSLLSDLTLHSG